MPKYYHRNPNGTFTVVKRLDNKNYSFGTFHTEKEAKDRVEFLKKMDWDLKYRVKRNNCNHIYYNGTCYFIQKNQEYYGSYSTRAEAKNAVKFFKEHDWDTQNYPRHVFKYYYNSPNGKYVVYKRINKRIYNFGRYDTEKEAMDMVDFLKQHDWDLKYAHIRNPKMKYILKVGDKYQIHRINDDGKIEHYGTFSTLEEAQAERDLYVRCNWDWELICNGGGL